MDDLRTLEIQLRSHIDNEVKKLADVYATKTHCKKDKDFIMEEISILEQSLGVAANS